MFILKPVTFLVVADALIPRIIDGEDAESGQFPFMARIEWGLVWYTRSCGGVIVDKYWILTAAHCWSRKPLLGQFRIMVGIVNVSNNTDHMQIAKIAKAIVHELYHAQYESNDLALLKLNKPLTLNNWVKEALLSESEIIDTADVVMVGWGSTSRSLLVRLPKNLQGAVVPIVDNKACEDTFNIYVPPTKIYESQFCTGNHSGSRTSTCYGDSGGPVVQIRNGHLEVIGIISWAVTPCGAYRTPSVHTRVSYYIEWIRRTIAQN